MFPLHTALGFTRKPPPLPAVGCVVESDYNKATIGVIDSTLKAEANAIMRCACVMYVSWVHDNAERNSAGLLRATLTVNNDTTLHHRIIVTPAALSRRKTFSRRQCFESQLH